MSKKILITGISGFAGSYLAEHLISQKTYDICGTYLTESSLANIASIQDRIRLKKLDLNEVDQVEELIKEEKPQFIFHLAALTAPGESFKNPAQTLTNNITAQIGILEGVRKLDLARTKILVVSSADMYGIVSPRDLPIDEETPFKPTNPYAVSKVTQDYLGFQYYLAYNLNIVRVRPFNHIGPRQSPQFVIASFARKIAEIEKGIQEPVMKVGNLKTKRDFTDVRDMVSAYVLILEKGLSGEAYNIGSGKSYEISKMLQKLLSLAKVKITIETDPSLLRPRDEPELICDNTKMRDITSWIPTISIDQTLKETLDYWRSIV